MCFYFKNVVLETVWETLLFWNDVNEHDQVVTIPDT